MRIPRCGQAAAALAALCGLWPGTALAAPGDLDPTFGIGGTTVSAFGSSASDYGFGIALDPAGRILVAGESDSALAVARYLPSGALDLSFGGGDGLATADFGSGLTSGASAVAVDAAGRIVAAGTARPDPTCTGDCEFAVVRFTDTGAPDPAFGGGDGRVTVGFGASTHDFALDVALDSSGRILIGGWAIAADEQSSEFAIVRLLEAGTLDPAYSGDGKTSGGIAGGIAAIALDTSGRLVVTGWGSQANVLVARFTSAGGLDPSFSGDGVTQTAVSFGSLDFPDDLALDSSGRVVVLSGSQPLEPKKLEETFPTLLRYTAGGVLDPTFGGGDGIAMDDPEIHAEGLAIDTSGRLVVSGYFQPSSSDSDFAVLRFGPTGERDGIFGGDGLATTGFGSGSFDSAGRVVVDGAGRVVVAGSAGAESGSSFALARYLGEPGPPSEPPTTLAPSATAPGTAPLPAASTACRQARQRVTTLRTRLKKARVGPQRKRLRGKLRQARAAADRAC